MKKWRVILLLAAAAILAALLLEVIQVSTQPGIRELKATEEMQQQENKLYPYAVTDMVGYEVTTEGLETVASDPQLYLRIYDETDISIVYFYFSPATEEQLYLQIFYSDKDGDYSEAHSVISECPPDTELWAVEIPQGSYPFLRIDIDGSVIPLDSIGVGNVRPGTVLHREGMHFMRIVFVAILLFAVLGWMTWCGAWKSLRKTFTGAVRGIREGGRKSILYTAAFPAGIGAAILLFWIGCTVIGGKPMTAPRIVFAGFTGFFSVCLLVFRKTLKAQPEYLFLILALCVGFLYSSYVPHTGLNAWDEDYHYRQALNTSYIDSIMLTQQDELTIVRSVPASYDLSGGIEKLHAEQDRLYRDGAISYAVYPAYNAIPELFNGIGLFIGRALGLRYYMIHLLGRFTGLIAYAFLGFFGIRKLKSGKMIAAVTLMIPTAMFLASSYNYDSYLTGFTALGLCYYTAQWQNREAKMSLKDAVIMIGSIMIGCLAKPVYIPMLWILIALPRDKFMDKRHHTRFVLALALATGAVIWTYLRPFIFSNTVPLPTDVRGGGDVNAVEQVKYILSHPMQFIRTMWRYTIDAYFNLNLVGEMLTNYAYLGTMPNQYLFLILLAVTVFTDKNAYDAPLVRRPWAHIWPILVSVGLVLIAEASMYIAFTPVGADTIAGAQFRYVIPAILPAALFIGSGKMENRMDRGWYNGLVLAAAAFVNFACVYNAYISRYY